MPLLVPPEVPDRVPPGPSEARIRAPGHRNGRLVHQAARGLVLFRTRIPLKLRDRFGRAEIVRSLPVRKRADAERLAPIVMSRCDVAFDLVAKSPEATQAECLDVLSRVIATAFSAADSTGPSQTGQTTTC